MLLYCHNKINPLKGGNIMHKKLQEEKLKLIVDTIQKGVYLAEVKMGALGLYDKNGLGLFSLNFIFKALREYTNDEFEVVQFKRGPFEMVFLYEAETKTLITFTSQNNAKRLQQRVAIKKAHYNDAFVLYNAGWFEEPQQLCLFSDETEMQRQKIYQDIEYKINSLDISQHVMICYDIKYKSFLLQGIELQMYSPHYYLIYREDLRKYIPHDFELGISTQGNSDLGDEDKARKSKNKFNLAEKIAAEQKEG